MKIHSTPIYAVLSGSSEYDPISPQKKSKPAKPPHKDGPRTLFEFYNTGNSLNLWRISHG
ncbi:MAG: hypothetical protein ACQKBT_04470 [Puniceicoccales bacterium]